MFGVGCSAFAFLFISGCWAPVLGADAAPATTFFDVTPGGVLAQLATAAITALTTWGAITLRRPAAERGRQGRQSVHLSGQPIMVREDAAPAGRDLCEARHSQIKENEENIFARLEAARIAIAKLEGTLESMTSRIASMDAKLDKLIGRRG